MQRKATMSSCAPRGGNSIKVIPRTPKKKEEEEHVNYKLLLKLQSMV